MSIARTVAKTGRRMKNSANIFLLDSNGHAVAEVLNAGNDQAVAWFDARFHGCTIALDVVNIYQPLLRDLLVVRAGAQNIGECSAGNERQRVSGDGHSTLLTEDQSGRHCLLGPILLGIISKKRLDEN